MVNVTFSIADYIHAIMRKHRDIRWTEIARQAITERARKMEKEDDSLRSYNLKRLAEGDDAERLFEI